MKPITVHEGANHKLGLPREIAGANILEVWT
jgi:hypothetical protein